ncbi:hypothetical protein I3843_02G147500 [Carya illinoinensis]|nr:hypothetical protein I3843_02G147500 [Carya illinoinensis]
MVICNFRINCSGFTLTLCMLRVGWTLQTSMSEHLHPLRQCCCYYNYYYTSTT